MKNICEQARTRRPPERGSPAWALGLGLARSAPAATLPTALPSPLSDFQNCICLRAAREQGCSQPLQQMVEASWLQHVGALREPGIGTDSSCVVRFLDLVALSRTLPQEWAFTLLCAAPAWGLGGSYNCLPTEPWLRFKSRGNCFGLLGPRASLRVELNPGCGPGMVASHTLCQPYFLFGGT